jgi:hypothetical protein
MTVAPETANPGLGELDRARLLMHLDDRSQRLRLNRGGIRQLKFRDVVRVLDRLAGCV